MKSLAGSHLISELDEYEVMHTDEENNEKMLGVKGELHIMFVCPQETSDGFRTSGVVNIT